MGTRVKTFDNTGIATAGRLYAGDLNLIQDQYADLVNLSQSVSVGSLAIGESGLQLLRYGAGEARISGLLRTDGMIRGLGGLYPGAYTTTQRNAIASGFRPYGLIILNTDNNRLEMNFGTDGSPNWQPLVQEVPTGAWDTTFTPTWSAAGGGFTGGTGPVNTLQFVKLGRTVIATVRYYFGLTASFGSGVVSFTLPYNIQTSPNTNVPVTIGHGVWSHIGANDCLQLEVWKAAGAASGQMVYRDPSTGLLTAFTSTSNPGGTIGTGSYFTLSIMYEATS